MPAHDWTKTDDGTFHAFHLAWIGSLQAALNDGILPPDHYALAEQIAGTIGPDIDVQPPRVRTSAWSELLAYAAKQRHLAIRHSSDDRMVAIIEIVSLGNKSSKWAIESFVDKAAAALDLGLHLLVADLFPPGRRDPQGIHGAIWSAVEDDSYMQPTDKPLMLVSYSAGAVKTAYIEPIAVGDVLTDMPLFLDPDHYVKVPLERTYSAAFRGMPHKIQRLLEDT